MSKISLHDLEERFNGGEYANILALWQAHEATCGGTIYGEDVNKGLPAYKETLADFDAVNKPRLEAIRKVREEYGLEWSFTKYPLVKFYVSQMAWARNAPKRGELADADTPYTVSTVKADGDEFILTYCDGSKVRVDMAYLVDLINS